jgi:hypothetical protein
VPSARDCSSGKGKQPIESSQTQIAQAPRSKRARRSCACRSLIVLFVSAWQRPSFAQTEPAVASTAEANNVVVLESPNLDPELEATISELLGRIQMPLVRRDGKTPAQPVARVWVEPFGEATRVSVENGRDKRLLIQRQVPPAATPALYRETVAHIIFSAVDALNSTPRDAPPAPPNPPPIAKVDSPIVATRAEPSATSPPTPKTPQHSASGLALKLGGRVGPRLQTNRAVGLGFSGVATLVMEEVLQPAVSVEAGYVLPNHAEGNEVTSEFHMIPIRARFGISPVRGERLSLETSLGFGVDVVSLQAQGKDDSVRATPETRRLQPLLESAVAVRWRVSPAVELLLAAGLDLDLQPRRWLYKQAEAKTVLFETARFRPFAVLGFDYSVLRPKPASDARGTP